MSYHDGVAVPGNYVAQQVIPQADHSVGQALFDENVAIRQHNQVSVIDQVQQNQRVAEQMQSFAVDTDFQFYYNVFDSSGKRVLLKDQIVKKTGNRILPNDDCICNPHSHRKSSVPSCFCCMWPTGDLPTFSVILKGEDLLIQYESDVTTMVTAQVKKKGESSRVFTRLERMAMPHSACCFPLFFLPCLFCCGNYKSFILEFRLLESNAMAARTSTINRSGSNVSFGGGIPQSVVTPSASQGVVVEGATTQSM